VSKKVDIINDFDILPQPKLKDKRLKRYYTFEDLLYNAREKLDHFLGQIKMENAV